MPSPDAPDHRAPRRRLGLLASATAVLALAVGVVVGAAGEDPVDAAGDSPRVATTAAAAASAGTQAFASRPDLTPTKITFSTTDPTSALGDIFTAPKSSTGKELALNGPMILDGAGNLVWFKYVKGGAYNFRTQTYQGKPVLTWWQGTNNRGYGSGEDVIYDTSYHKIATVKAGAGEKADLHEFLITPQNTALIIAYKPVRADLTGIKGGKKNDLIMDNVVQEIDIKTGKVLLSWHTAGTISPKESYGANPTDPKLPYDYVHLNSVDVDADGNLIASGRATHTYYRINRKTGKLIERIGGKKSDYKMGPGARTAFQHDVRRINATQLSAFDNNAQAPIKPISRHQTRGVILNVDEKKKTVTLARQIRHPGTPFQAASQGDMQTLANGDEFFGWGGSVPYFTEVDKNNRIVLEGKYVAPGIDSYRAFRAPWTGTPTDTPTAVAKLVGAQTQVAVSWNGATQVQSWRVLTGPSSGQLTAVSTVPHAGFETTTTVAGTQPVVEVQALDAAGNVLATSAPVTPTA